MKRSSCPGTTAEKWLQMPSSKADCAPPCGGNRRRALPLAASDVVCATGRVRSAGGFRMVGTVFQGVGPWVLLIWCGWERRLAGVRWCVGQRAQKRLQGPPLRPACPRNGVHAAMPDSAEYFVRSTTVFVQLEMMNCWRLQWICFTPCRAEACSGFEDNDMRKNKEPKAQESRSERSRRALVHGLREGSRRKRRAAGESEGPVSG